MTEQELVNRSWDTYWQQQRFKCAIGVAAQAAAAPKAQRTQSSRFALVPRGKGIVLGRSWGSSSLYWEQIFRLSRAGETVVIPFEL